MIGAIKRVLRGSDEENASRGIDIQPQPAPVMGVAPAEEESPEVPDEVHGGVYVPDGENEVERQAQVVRAAMEQGGRFGDREIPIPWLRRILAGLEGRHIDEEAMWEGIASPPRKDPVEESAAYQEFFQSHG